MLFLKDGVQTVDRFSIITQQIDGIYMYRVTVVSRASYVYCLGLTCI